MADQPRYEPLEESSFFPDHRSARPLPIGVIARGFLDEDELLYTGRVNGQLATTFPFEISAAVLARGRERYNIFCSPCHDYVGSGNGMAVRRGFRRGPPSFHTDRLREAPPGHFFDVISNGFGAMNDYAAQIKPRDRWAIIAYVRALQFSQNVNIKDLPAPDRQVLERLPRWWSNSSAHTSSPICFGWVSRSVACHYLCSIIWSAERGASSFAVFSRPERERYPLCFYCSCRFFQASILYMSGHTRNSSRAM